MQKEIIYNITSSSSNVIIVSTKNYIQVMHKLIARQSHWLHMILVIFHKHGVQDKPDPYYV